MTEADKSDSALVVAGGWCAPSATVYDLAPPDAQITLPDFRVLRPGTPEYHARQAEIAELRDFQTQLLKAMERQVGAVNQARNQAILAAQRDAHRLRMEVVVHMPPHNVHPPAFDWVDDQIVQQSYRFIGIELREPQEFRIVETPPNWFDNYWDWDD